MEKNRILAATLVFSMMDFVILTFLYCKNHDCISVFEIDIDSYAFKKSLIELWFIGLVRFSIVTGVCIGLFLNTDEGVVRLKRWCGPYMYGAAMACMFTIIKLLAVSDNRTLLNNAWFWGLFTWAISGAVLSVINLHMLTWIAKQRTLKTNVNCTEEESRPFITDHTQQTSTEARNTKKGTVLRLLRICTPDWVIILVGFIFLVLASTGQIFVPYYTGLVVDGIVIDKSETAFTSAIINMSLIAAGSAIAAGIRGGCLFLASRKRNIRVRNMLFSALLKQEIGFFDTVQTGDLTSRLTSDTTTMSDALGVNLNIFLRNFIQSVGVLVFMLKLSWRLTMVTVIGLPCVMAVSKIYGKYYKKLAEQVQDSLAEANNVAEEACSTMRTVRSFANEQGEINRYADKLSVTYKFNKKQAVMYSCFVWCSNLFELGLTVAVLFYGGDLVIRGKITGGRLISFILYQIQLGNCVNEMGSVFTGIMEAAGASEKVFEYIERTPRIAPEGGGVVSDIQGRIDFENISFSYPSRPDTHVLKDISFSVQPGEVVALVGSSGGGKTSCVNLLQHFYEPLSGQVLLDGLPVSEYDHNFIHQQMSLVGQEPVLYGRTIEENISYGLEEGKSSGEDIRMAAIQANAHKFITLLKNGYQTQTGEKGIQLSGGQKQRIAIARALIRKPKILLLDEATSALDSESEYLVQQALYQNMSGRTVIIIAHRLSTVERADRILVIDKGTVVEQGTHQQLLEKKGLYTSLVKRQMLFLQHNKCEQ